MLKGKSAAGVVIILLALALFVNEMVAIAQAAAGPDNLRFGFSQLFELIGRFGNQPVQGKPGGILPQLTFIRWG